MKTHKVYNEDCRDTMARIPDKHIDLTVTSPPYNMNLRISNGKYKSRQIVKELSTKYEGFDDNLTIEKFYALHSSILTEIVRVSKISFYNFQVVTGSKRAFFKLIGDFNEHIKDVIVWDKVNSQPAIGSGVMNSQNELILILGDNPISRKFSKLQFERGKLSNVWKIKRGRKVNPSHRAVFPEELVRTILLNFSEENDLIYDPFMGSGTTAKVAEELNRRWLGSETGVKYCEDTMRRLDSLM